MWAFQHEICASATCRFGLSAYYGIPSTWLHVDCELLRTSSHDLPLPCWETNTMTSNLPRFELTKTLEVNQFRSSLVGDQRVSTV